MSSCRFEGKRKQHTGIYRVVIREAQNITLNPTAIKGETGRGHKSFRPLFHTVLVLRQPAGCVCVRRGQRERMCVPVGGSTRGQANQGEGVTVACWTMAGEQYVGQGPALANLFWPESQLGVLNFCMHDQWH